MRTTEWDIAMKLVLQSRVSHEDPWTKVAEVEHESHEEGGKVLEQKKQEHIKAGQMTGAAYRVVRIS